MRKLILLFCLASPGCFGFSLPIYRTTPEIDCGTGDVKAYLISGETKLDAFYMSPLTMQVTKTELTLQDGNIAPESAWCFSKWGWDFWFSYCTSTNRVLAIELERPGYVPVTINSSWVLPFFPQGHEVVHWKKTAFEVQREDNREASMVSSP